MTKIVINHIARLRRKYFSTTSLLEQLIVVWHTGKQRLFRLPQRGKL
jgi:hypothetical protein